MKIVNVTGVKGEVAAAAFLKRKGYTIIEKNYRRYYGEIDIIAVHKNVLVFIEVKTRSSTRFGTALEAISWFKLKSLIKTAQLYKTTHRGLPESLRIDAISVYLSKNGEVLDIEHMENISG